MADRKPITVRELTELIRHQPDETEVYVTFPCGCRCDGSAGWSTVAAVGADLEQHPDADGSDRHQDWLAVHLLVEDGNPWDRATTIGGTHAIEPPPPAIDHVDIVRAADLVGAWQRIARDDNALAAAIEAVGRG